MDTTVDELKKLNNINNNMLSVGQVLKIPTKTVDVGDTDIYQVKSGDTLYSIAREFNTTVDKLKKLNNLSSNNLKIGQILIVKEV